MKELSVEEKAQRYDKAIKMAKSKIKNDKDHVLYEDDVIEIFPELKESEDERIRKFLIDYFEIIKSTLTDGVWKGFQIEKILAWLEKQGEQKSVAYSKENEKLIDDTCNLINTLASGYGTTNVTEPITFSGSQKIANIKTKLRGLISCK